MKKIFAKLAALVLALGMAGSCAQAQESINVISREDGSGTRGAFIELFGIEQKNAEGVKVDYTTDYADITNSTAYDQAFVNGRSFFDNISRLVDELFTSYLRRPGFVEPLAAKF